MWYRLKDKLVNLNNVEFIFKLNKNEEFGSYTYDRDIIMIVFNINNENKDLLTRISQGYDSTEERDAEFEKICKMLGLEETNDVV